MGRDFYEVFPEAREVFEQADRLLERPFSELIFNGPASELTLTKNSQLAIFIVSVAILRVFASKYPDFFPSVCSGLSLGEYTALVAAGKLSFEEGLGLVEARGRYMDEASVSHPGMMRGILGLEKAAVEEVTSVLEDVWIANLNCPGQVVISGTKEGVEKAASLLKEKGARRVVPLEVSGAFHSGLMLSAQEKLEMLIASVEFASSSIDVVMNVSGDYVEAFDLIKQNMISQVTHSVLWQKGVEAMVESGVELFIEMGPGKTLAGMNKRIGVSVPTLSVEKVEDLQGVEDYVPIA